MITRTELIEGLSKEGRVSLQLAKRLREQKNELTQEEKDLIIECVENTHFSSAPHENTWNNLCTVLLFGEKYIR